MKTMYRIRSKDRKYVAFFPPTETGKVLAKLLRKTDKRFKGGHIISVLQAYPSIINYGEVMEVDK